MLTLLKIALIVLIVVAVLFILTFTIYWFNLDMKLVRKLYDWLQTHYDKLEKDKKL